MKISKEGEHLMHFFEGYRSKPYRCSAAIWTIGFGHAMYADQLSLPNVRKEGYTGLIRSDYQLKEGMPVFGLKMNWSICSKLTSILLNVVFFDFLLILLVIKANSTLLHLLRTTQG